MCLDLVFRGISSTLFMVIEVILIGLAALNHVLCEDGYDISFFEVTSNLHGAL